MSRQLEEPWVNCMRCMKVHPKWADHLAGKEKEDAMWFPCLWVQRKLFMVPFLDIPKTKEALLFAEKEMWKRVGPTMRFLGYPDYEE